MKKIIAVSGVPGTGKTVVARIVAKKLKANLVEIKPLVGKEIVHSYDKKRRTRVVDIGDVQAAVSGKLTNGLNIIEGHYSHLLAADKIIVLRTSPAVLFKRLHSRKWPKRKIHENIECELLDEITQEAVSMHSSARVYEIDTTKKSPYVVADSVIDVIKGVHGRRRARVDWTEKHGYIFKSLRR